MTPDEYEARKSSLDADIKEAKKALWAAQDRFDSLCEESRSLLLAYREQQQRANADQRGNAR